MRLAAIDVGSNSVLLLVAERVGDRWNTLLEETDVTSLGAGTRQTGILGEAGMSRTLDALSRFYHKANFLGVDEVRAAATMAARIATNSQEFIDRAAAQNTPVRVLSGDDEARLGFMAVADDIAFKTHERLSIVDVGGQSTELVTASQAENEPWNILFQRSFAIGTLALRSGVLKREVPEPPEILSAVVELDEAIGLCYRRNQCGAVVCLGATGTNLVAIRERLHAWDPELVHGAWLSFGEISEQAGALFRLTELQRRAIVGLEPGREATLPTGALILERVLNAIGAPGAYVSTRGWRHALLESGYP